MKPEITVPQSAAEGVFAGVVGHLHKAGQFASVTFLKKDGTPRVMRFIAAQRNKYQLKGGQAAETRKANHPNLVNLIDFDAYQALRKTGIDETTARAKAFRSVNALTIQSIRFDGQVWSFV